MSFLRWFALTMVIACGDNLPGPPEPPTPDPWDASVAFYIERACTSPCRSGTEEQCRADLAVEFDRVKPTLDLQGHEECARCLDVKGRTLFKVVDCMPTAAQTQAVDAACDLDPTVDADHDGDPTDDYSDACGGVP